MLENSEELEGIKKRTASTIKSLKGLIYIVRGKNKTWNPWLKTLERDNFQKSLKDLCIKSAEGDFVQWKGIQAEAQGDECKF